MPGILYVVATPIGNLDDLTLRATKTLADVDFIAAEDTRVTLRLLNHLGLKKPLVSYHEHSDPRRAEKILERLQGGESCALCTDAGTPAISDPGERLVTEAHSQGITVVPVPGACAAVAALSVSGQATGRFIFEGFLPQNRRARAQQLEQLKNEPRTIIFYEAPHKLLHTLEDLAAAFGPARGVTLCREMTKMHEQLEKTTLAQALSHYRANAPRGEFVLVMEGQSPVEQPPALTLLQAIELALQLAATENLAPADAAKQAAAQSGHSRRTIYSGMQKNKAKNS